jgi:hypothetical protein
MARSSVIAVATFGSMALSGAIGVVWFTTAHGVSRFEPAVAVLGLLAGLVGVLAERRAYARERRQLTLVTLADELRRAGSVLDDPRFGPDRESSRPRVYPRLPVSATDAALVSGTLAERDDAELLRRLHNWRDEVNGFNRRLELTENRIFIAYVPVEVTEFERALHSRDGYLTQVRGHLTTLMEHVISLNKKDSLIEGELSGPVARSVNDRGRLPPATMIRRSR